RLSGRVCRLLLDGHVFAIRRPGFGPPLPIPALQLSCCVSLPAFAPQILRRKIQDEHCDEADSVIDALLRRQVEKRPSSVRLQGRVLFLTEDPTLIKKQLAGEDLPWDSRNPQN